MAKITLDVKDYEKGADGVKKSFADLQAEMKSMQSMSDALANRGKTLSARFDEEKAKLVELSDKLNKSAESSSETSEETQKLAEQFEKTQAKVKQFGTQLVSASQESANADKALDELKEAAEGASESSDKLGDVLNKVGSKSSTFGEKLKSGLVVAAKAGAAAVGAATTAVTALVKSAVENYGEYEQLVGGVETLFGDSANAVQEYAANAYRTAGMSANEYMETVTGFSASLLQSLDGDTAAAAEKADMAITDMADNANKMGTSMESIQNAYQGFAKQNYTMLDNLKLGYGGTKEEMERLLAKANEVNAQQGIITDYQIDSYADIVDAIHVVQTEMVITGTTSSEASTTIQGSVSSMKAAWANLVTGIADKNANMSELITNFVGTVVGDENGKGGVINNILPKVEQSLEGIGQVVDKMIPIIVEKVPTIVNEWLPKLLESGVSMIMSLLQGMMDNIDSITGGAVNIIVTLTNGILDNLPEIVVSAVTLMLEFAAGLMEALPDVLAKVPQIISELFDAFIENDDVFLDMGKRIVVGIWEGIKSLWVSLTENFSELFSGLSGAEQYQITGTIPSHKTGLDYVPYDGYIAQLHEGERVLTKQEAKSYNSGSGGNEQPIKIVVQSVLDGKVIGESVSTYNRRMQRARGM